MFVGHYIPALIAKRYVPEIPLWLYFVAVQLVDFAWALFVLLGVEEVRIVPGFTASNALDLHFMPFTHSLPASGMWAAGFALVLMALGLKSKRIVMAIFLAVMSHWLLDLLVHVPDLPLWGNAYKVGLGLWNSPWIAMTLEIGCLIAADVFLFHSEAGQQRGKALLTVLLVLIVSQCYSHWAPPPDSTTQLAFSALLAFSVFACLAFWFDRSGASKDGRLSRPIL